MNAARASLVALLLCWAFAAWADVAVPPLTGRVVDQTGTLSSADIASLTQTLKDFEARKGSQIAVLIVPTTAPETIEQYSIRVAEAWKIGRKKIDDGALLLVAKDDHKLRIEVGYGLEGALTDVTARRIIDEIITPKFRTGDFAGGISAGVDRIIAVIDGEPLPAPEPQQSFGGGDHIDYSVQSPGHFRRLCRRRIAADPARPADRLGRHRRRGRTGGMACHRIAGVLPDRGGRLPSSSPCSPKASSSSSGRRRQQLVRRRRFVFRRRQFERQRRVQRRRRQFRRRRRVGELVELWASSASASICWSIAGGCGALFPPRVLAAIEQAIKAGETTHSGQVRFVVEGALDGAPLFRDQSARAARASTSSRSCGSGTPPTTTAC